MSTPVIDPARSRIVLVGVPFYADGQLQDFEVIRHNVADLQAAFTDPTIGALDPVHCFVAPPGANIADIGTLLGKAAGEAEDLLLFYYCGHGLIGGMRDRQLYLSVRETDSGRVAYTALPFEAVRNDFLSSRAARRVVILDCCFSGRAIGGTLSSEDQEIAAQVRIDSAYILASAPADQSALVLDGERHTAFTGRLFEVLNEGKKGSDEALTLADIHGLLQDRLRAAGLPKLQDLATGGADRLPLVRNRAYRNPSRLIKSHAARGRLLAQLPALEPDFTGRDYELAVLTELLDPARANDALVSAVVGMAGVGKTALAVQAAHVALARGWCRGGVLFIDLYGYGDRPVEPSQALDTMLRALGVDAEHIPPTPEERAGLYRSILAQINEPVLVIADNASSEAQVRPLLPGTGPHKVIVTSRDTVARLGARLIDVMDLNEDDAIALLDTALRVARPGDDRVSRDRDVAVRLAGVCSGLPLALQIVAALLIADPALSAAELTDQLFDEKQRLERLVYDDGSEIGLSVAAAFWLSYRRLKDEPQRIFRLLPVSPGPDVSTAVTAVLVGMPTDDTRRVLSELCKSHLVRDTPGEHNRWRMHDLVRLYAERRGEEDADVDGREKARDRVLGYYLDTAEAAHAQLRALPGTAVPEAFPGQDAAVAWLDAERANLVAAVSMAAATDRYGVALRLPFCLAQYLSWRRRFEELIDTTATSLDAARRRGDRHSEGMALGNLGKALQEMRRSREAISALDDAAEIFREISDRPSEGTALDNIGIALQQLRQFDEAITEHRRAAAIFREAHDGLSEGAALNHVGVALREVGQPGKAIKNHRRAVDIFRAAGDQRAQAKALNNLGAALVQAGKSKKAITNHRRAADIFRKNGDRNDEGITLDNLGIALQRLGRFLEAIDEHQRAADICSETRDRHREGAALNHLGVALRHVGRIDDAITEHEKAAAMFREINDRRSEGSSLNNLGSALQEVGRFEEAITTCRRAAAAFEETGDQHGKGMALRNLEAARSALSADQA